MSIRPSVFLSVFLSSILLIGATASGVVGQPSGSIVGRVVDNQTLEPLAGAGVSLADGAIQGTSDADGWFVLRDVPTGMLSLRMHHSGHSTVLDEVEVAAGEVVYVQVRLPRIDAFLEELLVMIEPAESSRGPSERGGSASEALSRELDSSLTSLDLLASRLPGVHVNRSSGSVGGEARIRIRGMTTINMGNTPSVYVDGARVTPGGRSAGGSAHAFQVLENIPASQVKRIRVLRGAAAGALFGDSNNGIILIETISGTSGSRNEGK